MVPDLVTRLQSGTCCEGGKCERTDARDGVCANSEMRKEAAAEIEQLRKDNSRYLFGLNIIAQAGARHGGAWCVAQAVGHRDDLDFDHYPETGKPCVDQQQVQEPK